MSVDILPLSLRDEKRIYFFAQWSLVGIFLLVALIPVPAGLNSWIQSQASNWQNIQYLRLTLLLAGIGIAIQTYINQFQKQYDKISVTHHILITVLIVYVSVAIILLWKYLFGIIPDLETGEAIFLYTILSDSNTALFSKTNLLQPPFLLPIYGPLYYAAARFLMNILGESIFILRLITVFSLLVICGSLKVITQSYTNSAWSWVTPAIFLAAFPLVVWSGPPTKPEYFAALFSVCGFLVYCVYGDEDKKLWVVISAIFFSAALLIKFTIIIGLMATLVHLLLRRKYHAFVGLLILSIGSFLIIYFWFNTITNGGLFLFNILGNSVRPQILKIVTTGILQYLNNTFTVIASAAVVVLLTIEKSVKGIASLVGIAFLMALAFFIVSLGRPGSSANYFLEGVIFGSLAIGLLISSALSSPTVRGILWVVIFYLVLTLPTRAALIAQSYGNTDDIKEIVEQLRALDIKEDEYILSDLHYTYAVYNAEKKPLLLDNFYWTLLSDNNLIDSLVLYDYLNGGQIPYLVLHIPLEEHASLSYGNRWFPADVTEYLMQNYQCEIKMKRWDGSSFILCSRISSAP